MKEEHPGEGLHAGDVALDAAHVIAIIARVCRTKNSS
jgi:hypothetical protein